ncbi:hypothetical protein [Limnoglobus roseus]|uniref:Uncharacterized protein n=1 Tax=Limnoglobus roseus TaxID=2598579 RepID=A0A5C1AKE6_9BACT|nr:hypothetical protein [Limnoglobus roseus]QEL18486.1 hypothetical protein PX52LOC_05511 [Limnoglobus roseus]
MVRKLVLLAVIAGGLAGSTGCLMNQYAADPNVRMEQLINQSEDQRQIGEFWRRFWFNDQPSHLTPARIHGGI